MMVWLPVNPCSSKEHPVGTILVTGIAGGLAQRVAERLLSEGHTVIGVDYREVHHPVSKAIKVYRANYNKTIIEDVFKHHAFDVVLHLGRVGNLKESPGKRFDLNVVGSQKIMNLCNQHHVKRLVVLSTFHIYGAHHANHVPISEEDPLRAGLDFPQLGDAIQLDNMASTWVYQFPAVCTTVLRVTNVVGPNISNAMSSFLRKSTVPYVLGFNPMTQFIHEDDLTDAILATMNRYERGVFNVAGDALMPWRTALKLARAKIRPLPGAMVDVYITLAANSFPSYLVNFFKYPCVITDEKFRKTFDWAPKVPMDQTIWSTVREVREGKKSH
jgi:UDP-glucose 4-epimerase